MTDIVERLRTLGPDNSGFRKIGNQAADEIELLRNVAQAAPSTPDAIEMRVAKAIVNQWREGGWEKATANERYDGILEARAAISAIPAQAGWQLIETRPEFDHQPGRQFILLEGSCRHSDANWHRQFAGEAYIRKPGQPDEMLQYRMNDILRICQDGDIDPHTARVTHWMPGAYPHFPSSLSSAQRARGE